MTSEKGALRTQIADSTLWIALGLYMDQALRIAVSAILSRLLTPQEFGIVGMVAVFAGFLGIFSTAGLSSTVIQFQKLGHRDLSSIFWFSLLLGGLFSASFAAASPVIAGFYHLPELQSLSAVMGLGFLIGALCIVPSGLLQQQMRFRTHTLIDISSSFIAAAVAVIFAVRGASYWTLVIQSLLAGSMRALLFFIAVRWRPMLSFSLRLLRDIFSFSGNLTLFTAVNYWARNLDNLLIGRFLGTSSLGYYSRAYTLMTLPMNMVTGAAGPTIHPAFAKIQDDLPRMYQAYLRLLKVIAMLSLPIMVALALLAPEFVFTLWGSQWDQSVPIFRILCIVGAVQPIVGTTGSVYLALNRASLLFKVGAIVALIVCSGIVAGLPWGLRGIAVGYSVAYGLITVPVLHVVLVTLLKGSLKDLFNSTKSSLWVAAGVGIAVAAFNVLVRGSVVAPLHLVLGATLALIVILCLLYLLELDLLRDLYRLLPSGFRTFVKPLSIVNKTLDSLRPANWR